MRRGGGKQKGSAFERKVCRLLSLWMSHGEKEDLLWRSAMSGGRATVAKKKGIDIRQAGDITAVAPEGHALTDLFYIECKNYRDLQIDSFILDNRGKLAEFWRIAVREADRHERCPMLIAKENRRHPIIMTMINDIDLLCSAEDLDEVKTATVNISYVSFSTPYHFPEIRYLYEVLKCQFRPQSKTNRR